MQKHTSNPVLPVASMNLNTVNALQTAGGPSVLFDSILGAYRIWFTARSLFSGLRNCISTALSANKTDWYLYSKEPVPECESPGSFDDQSIESGIVMKHGTYFRMYYTATSNNIARACLALSVDGYKWQKSLRNPILSVGAPGEWGSAFAGFPHVIHTDSGYMMWYAGSNGSVSAVGVAISPDGEKWTTYAGHSVLVGDPSGGWDQGLAAAGEVVEFDGIYYTLYNGDYNAAIGLATSSDGLNWVKICRQSGHSPGGTGPWDEMQVNGSTLLYNDSTLYLWYGAENDSGL